MLCAGSWMKPMKRLLSFCRVHWRSSIDALREDASAALMLRRDTKWFPYKKINYLFILSSASYNLSRYFSDFFLLLFSVCSRPILPLPDSEIKLSPRRLIIIPRDVFRAIMTLRCFGIIVWVTWRREWKLPTEWNVKRFVSRKNDVISAWNN